MRKRLLKKTFEMILGISLSENQEVWLLCRRHMLVVGILLVALTVLVVKIKVKCAFP